MNECPICYNTLPGGAGSEAAETHMAACIESQLADVSISNENSNDPPGYSKHNKGKHLFPTSSADGDSPSQVTSPAGKNVPEANGFSDFGNCPVCNVPFSGGRFKSESVREEHVDACLNGASSSTPVVNNGLMPMPMGVPVMNDGGGPSNSGFPKEKTGFFNKSIPQTSAGGEKATGFPKDKSVPETMEQQETREVGTLRKWFSSIGGEKRTKEQKTIDNITRSDEAMKARWGGPNSPTYEVAMRYIVATRMQQYWEALGAQHPREFIRYLDKGYMEPIPTAWVKSRKLAWKYPEDIYWETPAEKRLYYLLNNGVMPDGTRHAQMRPLNISRDRKTIIQRGNERNARQQHLDVAKLLKYQSAGDVFHNDKQIKSHIYSDQVQNTVSAARQAALHELADGIAHGTDHLETMILLDVSGSMTWNPHAGVTGPDGIRRYHDQPSNIALVQHLVYRVLHHMIARAQKEHPRQQGIDTVTFSSYGNYVGQLSAQNFNHDWRQRVRVGGATQVMQGWQVVKNTYFEHQHATAGHGRWDEIYGWQPTPGMPKLSLLVFLDGEAMDMDEFELDLLGETWAYVTIALVGMENCPHHHSHAIELERVAAFNPHVGFFDVHGRVCERMVVEDLLGSVYPVDPPHYDEILNPAYDLPPDKLPAYTL